MKNIGGFEEFESIKQGFNVDSFTLFFAFLCLVGLFCGASV